MRHLARVLLLLAFCPFAGVQDTPALAQTLRTQVRLVVVNVVVTGKDHAAVHGLKQADFIVLDKGAPQTLRFFEEHSQSNAASAQAPPMPPGTFTNFGAAPVDGTLNILLLDSLSTPVADQNYYAGRVRAFLDRMHPGAAVAIFALSSKLRLLQGFTTDHAAIRRAMDKPRNQSLPYLDSPADGVDRGDGVDALIAAEPDNGSLSDGLALVAGESEALELRTRVLTSIDELSALTRYLSEIPGRKSLIWAIGGFSLVISPTIGGGFNSFREVTTFGSEFRSAIKLLAQSQTAVYTIDPQGLATAPSGDVRQNFTSIAASTQPIWRRLPPAPTSTA